MTRDSYSLQPHPQHQQHGAADVTLTSPTSRQAETSQIDVMAQGNGLANIADDSQLEEQVVLRSVVRTGVQTVSGEGEGELDAQHITTTIGTTTTTTTTTTTGTAAIIQNSVSDVTSPPAAEKTDVCDPLDSCDVRGKASFQEEEEGEKEGGGCCGRQKDAVNSVGVFSLFRYAGLVEVMMMAVGTLAAIITGCMTPVSLLLTSQVVNTFINNAQSSNITNGTHDWGSIQEDIQALVYMYLALGAATLVSAYASVSLWTWAGQRQITHIRKLFFRSAMRQDMTWFDTHPVAELSSRFSDDMHKIHEGLADKVPVFLQWCSTCLAAYVIAFVTGWKLALAVLAFSPLFVAVASAVSWMMRGMAQKEMKSYARAGAVAEQALRAVRTVQAFDGQHRELSKYEDNLVLARRMGVRKGLVVGAGTGLFYLTMYSSFAVSYYYGVVLIQTEALQPGSLFVVFFAMFFGSLSLGYAFSSLEIFSNARAAAAHIFDVIALHPHIDVSSSAGLILTSFNGDIEFRDVHFRYPARPEVPVLGGLSLTIAPGQTVALVGSSGCGKSTTLQLLHRFYDPASGQVCLDGHDIRELNVRWLRDQLGVVSQEPVLFAATIADNIRYGQPGVTDDLVRSAAVEANAHDFICRLPQGYDTQVGERGTQLSGGQKQRIAIARALVKNPRILLLDEATSALDSESEAVVQNALDKARRGRTTIVIAHRLSTIRHADVIVTLSGGRKVEEGSHQALMSQQGMYATLLRAQSTTEQEHEHSKVSSDVTAAEREGNDVNRSVTNGAMTSGSEKTAGSAGCDGDSGKEGETPDTTTENKGSVGVRRLLAVNRPEWPLLVIGTALSAMCGLSQPCFTFIFSEFFRVFAISDEEEQTRQTIILSSAIGALGVTMTAFRMGSAYCFSKAGAALTARLRSLTFCSMLNQDMSFFDHPDNQVGSLTTRLAYDAALVQGATACKLGTAIEILCTVTASLVIAFVYGWKLALVLLAFLPIVMVAGRIQGRVITGSATSSKSQLQEAGKICSEAVDNIRTVTSLNRADVFIHKMEAILDSNSLSQVRMAQVFGLTYSLSSSIRYFAMSACFMFGATLVDQGEMQFHNIFRVFGAIVMGGSSVGRRSSFGVDYSKGRVAASRLFSIMDRVPAIDCQQTGGKTLPGYRGEVGVEGAVFQYPGREQVRVLAGLTVRATPGQTVAVVGPSGCGKSTLLQLLLRFYDPSEGQVVVGGADVRTLDLKWWRHQVGMVSQEPLLFDDTVAANIAYGDTSRPVPMAEVIRAARAANIHDFVTSLPLGYETPVGDKGTQLSGGQKQRLAIARALVRQPKVLLLDEATSALDTQSERVVQEALDRARQGRTCFVIAHRLTTVQTADVIVVIQDGHVQEMGTHSQLLASRGAYYGLLQAQHYFWTF